MVFDEMMMLRKAKTNAHPWSSSSSSSSMKMISSGGPVSASFSVRHDTKRDYLSAFSLNSEVKLPIWGENDIKRDETTTSTFNDDDELEHVRCPNGTQTIVVEIVVVVVVTKRDDDARRTRTRETFKTTSGENTDESE
jgi:hypothetical protein